ncbi:AfsR/SARP family transcriptional regulator [Rhizohabitans arisaemae]|uniref:AfsR/SARP family transcriptional regulator n=1 Tax=Rhizohabitans arisaemae TaxID=2720610 RepID=UPI0024B237AD|nr:AfsR/SARP family transcriptional regulator [Rhizohabitans arisaemae]
MEFRVLGPVQAWAMGHMVDVGERKQRLVLAALLLEANRLVPVAWLESLLWPGEPPPSARRTIQAHVSRLRQVLTKAGAERHGVSLVRRGDGYVLTCDADRIDAHRFRTLLTEARCIEDDADKAHLLRGALDLWRGPPMADTATEEIRERLCCGLEEARLTAVEERINAELRLGRHLDVIDELSDLAVRHPHRHRLTAQLMLTLHRAGRTADALRAYEHARRRFGDDLGLDPPAELRQLHVGILRADPSLDFVPLAGGRVPLVPVTPAQLPADVPDFIGRDRPLDELRTFLRGPGRERSTGPSLCVITGSAGTGKTALAVHWGHQVAETFPGGQLFLNLSGHAAAPPLTPLEALRALLRGLGVPQAHTLGDVEQTSALYRSLLARRRILIVLDDAVSADQVRPLIPGNPACPVVVTSRNNLAGLVAHESARRIEVGGFTDGEARALLASVLGPARVAAEPEATAETVRLCGHLPLALRIAAAQLAAAGPHTELGEYLDELSGANRLEALRVRGDERSSVKIAYDRSYMTLTTPARRCLRMMGLALGGEVSADATAVLCGTTSVHARDLLGQLSSANLVERRSGSRFRLHELVRCYAEHLSRREDSQSERRAAVHRLVRWYLLTADYAVRLLHAGEPHTAHAVLPDRAAALTWLKTEQTNLVAAIGRASAHPNLPPRLVHELTRTLKGFFVEHGRPAEVSEGLW